MGTKVVTKVGATIQDLFLGVGADTQTRNGKTVPVNKIAAVFMVASVAELQDFPVDAEYAAIADGSSVTNYYYDSESTATVNGTTVIQPNNAAGRWLVLPGSAPAEGDVVSDTITFTADSGSPGNDIQVRFDTQLMGTKCFVIATVLGSSKTLDNFDSDANNVRTVLGSGTITESQRPDNQIHIPLSGYWTGSNGQRTINAYLVVSTDGTVRLLNIQNSATGVEQFIAAIDDTGDNYAGMAINHTWWTV